MKKFKIFLLLLILGSGLFADTLMNVFDVPLDCELNLAVKILKDKGFKVNDIEYYKHLEQIIITLISDKGVNFHSSKINYLRCYFTENELHHIYFEGKCLNYDEFEKSIIATFSDLKVEKFFCDYTYRDPYSKRILLVTNIGNDLKLTFTTDH